MELSIRFWVVFFALCLAALLFYYVISFFLNRRFAKWLQVLENLHTDIFPELAAKYSIFILEQYNVDIIKMSYEEHIIYVATHFSFLDRKSKKYFSQGAEMRLVAAVANLGELIKSRYKAEWIRVENKAIPVLQVNLPWKKTPDICDLFGAFMVQKQSDEATNIIEYTCFCIGNEDGTFLQDIDQALWKDAIDKYCKDICKFQ